MKPFGDTGNYSLGTEAEKQKMEAELQVLPDEMTARAHNSRIYWRRKSLPPVRSDYSL